MKLHPSLQLLIFASATATASAQSSVTSTNYPSLFSPAGSVTVTPTASGILNLTLGGTASGNLGTYWAAQADGGAAIGLIGLPVLQTGAQVALTGSSLQFNVSNDANSLLGYLGVGTSLSLSWQATATFNAANSTLTLMPNTTYDVTFDVDTGSGLLNSTLGITPTFGVSLLDANGTAIGTTSNTTVANILGLQLLGVVGSPSLGAATIQFKTGPTVPSGPAKLRFTGSAALPATLGNVGTHFATVSNLSITPHTPYLDFINDSNVTDPNKQDPSADPDGDGKTNLAEFAMDTDPAVADGDKIYTAIGDPDGSGSDTSVFVMTLPVRTGAVFSTSTSGNNADISTVDGVTYEVQGSFDLVNWTAAVSEVTPNTSFTSNLPALDTGWSYRSFRVPGQTSDTPKAFLRVKFY